MKKTSYTIVVNQQDLDFTQQLSYTSLIGYIISVADQDATANGFGVGMLNAQSHSWVLSRLALEITSRPRLGDTLHITTWVSDFGRVLTTRNFSIADESGRHLAYALTQWCLIDLSSRSVVALSSMGTTYGDCVLDESLPIAKPRKINTSVAEVVATHCVGYSDIDFNGHVNTLRYFGLMLDVLTLDELRERDHTRIELHFVSESRHGDTLSVKHQRLESSSVFEIAREDGSVSVRGSFGWGLE